MNKRSKFLGIIFLFAFCYNGTAQTGINRISKEQKLYELSVVWKELSYNFANMDNCPNVDLDSLYREYIIIVQNTKNDWEYYKAIRHFLCHFNNGHVACYWMPDYFLDYLGTLLLTTTYKDNKVIVENIGAHNANKIGIGDEIISVNGIPVIDYLQKNSIPYIAASNEESKTLHRATFGGRGLTNTALKDEKIKLKIKTSNGIKKVVLAYDKYYKPTSKDTIVQKNRKYLDTTVYIHSVSMRNNLFLEDTINDFAYIRLTRCDESFSSFFDENYDKILKHRNLIVDVHYNEGGSSNVTDIAIARLINNDSIYTYTEKTRVNNALHKAWAAVKILLYEDDDVPEFHKINYYPYYYNTAFDKVSNEIVAYPSNVPDSLYYKGNVYVLISEDNASAGEYFAAMLSQNKDITFLGKKTAGAFGQPLLVRLPSGIEVIINTTKTFDFRGNDISSGFPPDYEYDFLEIHKITDPQKMLSKLIEVIKELK
ncbi:MAG: S41 family peptidase [Lentimicrobiaceae bacterium]|nr:S41 family peptidase [Lentimicrobiaceae bacterium]